MYHERDHNFNLKMLRVYVYSFYDINISLNLNTKKCYLFFQTMKILSTFR